MRGVTLTYTVKLKVKLFFFLLFLIFPVIHSQNLTSGIQALDLEKEEQIILNYKSSIKQKEYIVNYITHPTIEIKSDLDFGNYSSTGIGTHYDPFIIENYNITTTNDTAITVESTSRYFVIRNCLLSAKIHGIYLYNISFGTSLLENNNCSLNNGNGIWGKFAHGAKFVNNTCSNNRFSGILLKECNNVTFSENYCKFNPRGGIILDDCLNSEVEDNIVIRNSFVAGIRLHYSNGSKIVNNVCINNEVAGILCGSSDNSIIKNNYVYNDNGWGGIGVSDSLSVVILNNTSSSDRKALSITRSPYSSIISNTFLLTGMDIVEPQDKTNYLLYTVEDNTVNGKKLGFFTQTSRMTIDEPCYGQLMFIDCQKITVKNQRSEEGFLGISLHNCISIKIKDSQITNSDADIKTWGIRVYDSEDIEITNCICSNGRGIYLENTLNSLIKSNLCQDGPVYGISLEYSENCEIVNNTCIYNNFGGIEIKWSKYCEITYNRIEQNGFTEFDDFGLELSGSNNTLHHNIFIANDFNGTVNAIDEGSANIWFDEKSLEGNFWDTWSGDGVYNISGSANSIDPYPLSEIPVYTESDYFALYFSIILIVPIITFAIIKLVSKRKN